MTAGVPRILSMQDREKEYMSKFQTFLYMQINISVGNYPFKTQAFTFPTFDQKLKEHKYWFSFNLKFNSR